MLLTFVQECPDLSGLKAPKKRQPEGCTPGCQSHIGLERLR